MTKCQHRWFLPSPTPGAEWLDQTCYFCGTSKRVPAYGDWDANSKKGWVRK